MLRRKLAASVACVFLAVLLRASAGTIVEGTNFNLASHGTFFKDYDQLPPDLAPLNAVKFDLTAVGTSGFFVLSNTSPDAVTFHVFYDDIFETYAG